MEILTQSHLREAVAYNPESGLFHWIKPASNRVKAGDAAGSRTAHGYTSIRIDGRAYQAHRLAWLHTYGVWPTGEIDHLNADRTDNRISNLRDVDGRINRQNIRVAKATSQSGVLGVSAKKGKKRTRFVANINVGGRKIYVGTYDTQESAHAAYADAKREAHAGCTL